jgi:hypothetical protein
MDQREHLLKTSEKERRTNDDLDEAITLSTGTIGQGMEIMEELDRQKDVMTVILDKVIVDYINYLIIIFKTRDVQYKLKKAGRYMRTMYRRNILNKIILFVIIFALLAGIGLVVYFKWFYQESTTTSDPNQTGTTGTTGTTLSTSTSGV